MAQLAQKEVGNHIDSLTMEGQVRAARQAARSTSHKTRVPTGQMSSPRPMMADNYYAQGRANNYEEETDGDQNYASGYQADNGTEDRIEALKHQAREEARRKQEEAAQDNQGMTDGELPENKEGGSQESQDAPAGAVGTGLWLAKRRDVVLVSSSILEDFGLSIFILDGMWIYDNVMRIQRKWPVGPTVALGVATAMYGALIFIVIAFLIIAFKLYYDTFQTLLEFGLGFLKTLYYRIHSA